MICYIRGKFTSRTRSAPWDSGPNDPRFVPWDQNFAIAASQEIFCLFHLLRSKDAFFQTFEMLQKNHPGHQNYLLEPCTIDVVYPCRAEIATIAFYNHSAVIQLLLNTGGLSATMLYERSWFLQLIIIFRKTSQPQPKIHSKSVAHMSATYLPSTS